MPKPLSSEKRADIIKHHINGENSKDIAKWEFISVRTVERVVARYKATGNYDAFLHNCGRKPLISEEKMKAVVERVKLEPDITLAELINVFNLPFSTSALCKRLRKLGFTFKKKRFIQRLKPAKT
jgi:transposase